MTDKNPVEKSAEEVKAVPAPLTEREIVWNLAEIFGLPAVGINYSKEFGNKAYINSVGIQAARRKYPLAVSIHEVKRLKQYEHVGDIAVVEVTGEYRTRVKADLAEGSGDSSPIVPIGSGFYLIDDITEVGTASAANMSMGKDYPNELAVTRAINRFLRRALLPYLYSDAEENIKTFPAEKQNLMKPFLADFGSVSIEELSAQSNEDLPVEVFLTNEEMDQIKSYLIKLTEVETQEELDTIIAEVKATKDSLNEGQLKKIRDVFATVRKKKQLV